MKVTKQTNERGRAEVTIVLTEEDAELMQTVVLRFAEKEDGKVAKSRQHNVRMRRLAMLIDKVLTGPAGPKPSNP